MKQIVIAMFFFVLSQQIFSQEGQIIKEPKVDKRVELLSIVFQLAGNEEFNATYFKKYSDDVKSHFSLYKNHELIGFAKELREKKSISYDAVLSMAVILDDKLNPLIDLSTTIPEKRWNKDDANKFIILLTIVR